MKKIFSALLSVMLLISITSSAFAAEPTMDDVSSPEVIEVEVPIAGADVDTPVIELNSNPAIQWNIHRISYPYV